LHMCGVVPWKAASYFVLLSMDNTFWGGCPANNRWNAVVFIIQCHVL
jgi:hypothetical protein